MEFERALFRIYEKTVQKFSSSAQDDRSWRVFGTIGQDLEDQVDAESGLSMNARVVESSRPRSIGALIKWYLRVRFWVVVEQMVLLAALICLFFTGLLHYSYAGEGTCLQEALMEQHGIDFHVLDRVEFEENGHLNVGRNLLSDSILRLSSFGSQKQRNEISGTRMEEMEEVEEVILVNQDEGKLASENIFVATYEFSCTPASLKVNNTLRSAYSILELNITLEEDRCIGRSWIWKGLMRFVFGYDAVVVNQAMYAFKCSGLLRNLDTHEVWLWDKDDFDFHEFGVVNAISFRLVAVLKGVCSFALVTSVTALLVRVLVSSGVAIVFPIFTFLQTLGVHNFRTQLLSLSYPWLGAQIELLRVTNQDSTTLVNAHIVSVLIFYTMYDASQIVWSFWLYIGKTGPTGQIQQLFGLIMLCEYYSAIFARSRLTIQFFPKFMMLYYVTFHVYFYCTMYGFTSVLTIALYFGCIHCMIYCIRCHEVKCYQRGLVSFEQPRSLYNEIPYPSWNMLLPPLWSMFHSLNRVQSSIYDENDSVANFVVRNPPEQQQQPSTSTMERLAPPAVNVVVEDDDQDVPPPAAPTPLPSPPSRQINPEPTINIDSNLHPRHAAARAAETRRRLQQSNTSPTFHHHQHHHNNQAHQDNHDHTL